MTNRIPGELWPFECRLIAVGKKNASTGTTTMRCEPFQRKRTPTLVRIFAKKWKPAAVGIIILAETDSLQGQPDRMRKGYSIIDGRQRMEEIWENHSDITHVWAAVYSGLTYEDRVNLYEDFDVRVKHNGWDKVVAMRERGDRHMEKLDDAMTANGYALSHPDEPHAPNYIRAIRAVLGLDGSEAPLVFGITKIWFRGMAPTGDVIRGLSKFFKRKSHDDAAALGRLLKTWTVDDAQAAVNDKIKTRNGGEGVSTKWAEFFIDVVEGRVVAPPLAKDLGSVLHARATRVKTRKTKATKVDVAA